MSSSIYEAKAGVRASLTHCYANTNPEAVLGRHTYIKKLTSDLVKYMKKGNRSGLANLDQPAKTRSVFKELKKCWDAIAFTTMALPAEAPWSVLPFMPSLALTSKYDFFLGLAPFGLMQAKTVLAGAYLCYGCPVDKIPGASYGEKRAHLLRSADSLYFAESLRAGSGFVVKLVPDDMLLVPSGFMVYCAAMEPDSKALMWSVSGDKSDNDRVVRSLQMTLREYPALQRPSEGYEPFLQYLMAEV